MEDEFILSVPEFAFHPWYIRPSSLHMESVHTRGSLFTKSLYPSIFPVVSQVMWCDTCSTMIVSFSGYILENIVWAYMCCWCVYHILFEHLRCILECCHMIYFGPGIILVCAFSCPSNDTIFLFFSLGSHGAVVLVYPLLFLQISFLVIFHFQQLNAGFWFAENIYHFFAWFTGWSSSGYAPTIGTLRGSALVTGFDCGVFFIWVPSWFISWSFFWTTSLAGTLGGTAGVFIFWIYRL